MSETFSGDQYVQDRKYRFRSTARRLARCDGAITEREVNLRLVSVPQAAEMTGLHPNTIRRLFDEGQISGNTIGKVRKVSVASLEAWVNRTPEAPAVPTSASRAFPEVEDRYS